MSIGQRVKTYRVAMAMSQEDLAKKAGITQATLSSLENDKSKGSAKLSSIANALGVRAFWLETGRGSPEPFPEAFADIPPKPAIFSTQGDPAGWLSPLEEYQGNFATPYVGEDSYALRIKKGDAFGDRISSGDILMVSRSTSTEPGDIVVLQTTTEKMGIWRLRYIRDDEICVDPLSKQAGPLTFDAAEVISIHKIVAIIPR